MDAIHYFPSIVCAKCNGRLLTDVRRVHDPAANRRYLVARCHNESVEVEFVMQLGAQVKVFEPS